MNAKDNRYIVYDNQFGIELLRISETELRNLVIYRGDYELFQKLFGFGYWQDIKENKKYSN
jgi:hypothetical protein